MPSIRWSLALGVGLWIAAAPPPVAAQAAPLDALVAEGLAHNPDLHRAERGLERAEWGAREAAGRWLPSVTLNARYSERSGNILDIGSLVNPAFGALNQLLGQDAFPTDVSLKQPYKQETTLRLTQPLFQPAVAAGVHITRAAREAERATVAGTRRDLAARIRLAYLDYARAARLEELYTATLVLLDENLRVNESLLAAGSATPDAVLRARADRSEGAQRLAEAARLRSSAREAFNALLDRPAEMDLPLFPDSLLGLGTALPRDSAVPLALGGRSELAALRQGIRATDGEVQLAGSAFLPSLVAVVDWGVQGDRYRFAGREDFLIASVVLQWNLFNGGQDRARRRQAEAHRAELEDARAWAARQVALEASTAWRAMEVARLSQATAADRLASAERSYQLVERKYREGAAPLVELTDARTAFVAAGLNRILTTYDYYARCVELARATATYPREDGP